MQEKLETPYTSILDFVLLPFVLTLVYGIAYQYRNKHYGYKHPWRKYFIPALSLKIFGALFICLIYLYYYGGGDTTTYYMQSRVINSAMNESFIKWINLVFHIPGRLDPGYYQYTSQLIWYRDIGSYTTCAITAVMSLITLKTFIPAAVLFAAISFTGIWALFRTFAKLYPQLTKPVAIATLFIPSTFVWGSGIFKDTICIFGLGWLTYSVFRLLIKRDFRPANIILAIASFILIAKVKMYILMAFLPALVIWVLFVYTKKIKSTGIRVFIKTTVIVGSILGSVVLMQSLGEETLGRYSLEKLEETAETTRDWILYSSGDEGSGYSLGDFDPSFAGMVTKFPLAVNVTLFRPYLWESGKVIIFLSALEAFLFLFLTLKLIFVVGIRKILHTVSKEPTIQFCLIFSLIFAFAVGISSYNFGSLSRYKIPCLPFYGLFLILVYYKNMPLSKKLFRPLGI